MYVILECFYEDWWDPLVVFTADSYIDAYNQFISYFLEEIDREDNAAEMFGGIVGEGEATLFRFLEIANLSFIMETLQQLVVAASEAQRYPEEHCFNYIEIN